MTSLAHNVWWVTCFVSFLSFHRANVRRSIVPLSVCQSSVFFLFLSHIHIHIFFFAKSAICPCFMCRSCYSLCWSASLLAPLSARLPPGLLLLSFHQHFSLIIEATFRLPHATFALCCGLCGTGGNSVIARPTPRYTYSYYSTLLVVVAAGIAQNLGYSNPTML